ncbi:MAG: TRAP transporter small permease subunit [Polyangiales bacterium]
MDPRPEVASTSSDTSSPPIESSAAASWTRPLVKIDALGTRIETVMVLTLLVLAILYMSGWVTLNAFHTKGGKLARFPGSIALFAGLAWLVTWARDKNRKPMHGVFAVGIGALGVALLWAARKQDYFANIAHWLTESSLIAQMGPPQIVSARLFTIWIALLGGSLATSAGRQINIDVVMRFIGPKPRLVVVLLGYTLATAACFTVSWGFLDYLAITRFHSDSAAKPGAKLADIAHAMSRHAFVARKQVAMDLRSFSHVVLKGETYDKWYRGADWNAEVNSGGWIDAYPAPTTSKPAAGAPAYPTKPCLEPKEIEALLAAGGGTNPDWHLPSVCDQSEGGMRAPLATAPEPDDRAPLEADLSLLFPWGFLIIGCRFILRALLAVGGAVSTDPNAAHAPEDFAEHESQIDVAKALTEVGVAPDPGAKRHEEGT